jgi:hypothetical protein
VNAIKYIKKACEGSSALNVSDFVSTMVNHASPFSSRAFLIRNLISKLLENTPRAKKDSKRQTSKSLSIHELLHDDWLSSGAVVPLLTNQPKSA